jgi:uncharacterized protein YjiS (DUF1127 family)
VSSGLHPSTNRGAQQLAQLSPNSSRAFWSGSNVLVSDANFSPSAITHFRTSARAGLTPRPKATSYSGGPKLISQHKLDPSIGCLRQEFTGAFPAQLGFIRFHLYKLFRWLRDEKVRYKTIRELDRLNDDYLDDIGIKKRSDIRPIVNALVKRRRERRYRPRRF